jgi:hypothetical protein
MTRISGYELVACPSCGQQHTRTLYGSISIYVPSVVSSAAERSCARCGEAHAADAFQVLGFISKEDMVPPAKPPLLLRISKWIRRSLLGLERRQVSQQKMPWELPHLR